MHIFNLLNDFLYDKEYFIANFNNQVYIYQYQEIIKLNIKEVIIRLKNFKLIINGDNLKVETCSKQELRLTGEINEIKKIYE